MSLASLPTDRTHKQFWTEFFQLFKENPCLWDHSHPTYHLKNLKTLALNVLLEKYWEIDSLATLETVKSRLATFRMGFNKEHKRVTEAALNGALFTSRLWYYNYVTFLKNYGQDEETLQEWERNDCSDNVIELTHGTVVFNSPEDSARPDTFNTPVSSPAEPAHSNLPTITGVTSIYNEQPATQLPMSYILPMSTVIDQIVDKTVDRTVDKTVDKPVDQTDEEDDCSTFAAHVKMRMRKFNPSQKMIAQKLISDVMFMADTAQLQLNSSVINPLPPHLMPHTMIPIGPVAIPHGSTWTTMVPASVTSEAPVNMTSTSVPKAPANKVPISRSNNGANKTIKPAGGKYLSYIIDSDSDDVPLKKKKTKD